MHVTKMLRWHEHKFNMAVDEIDANLAANPDRYSDP